MKNRFFSQLEARGGLWVIPVWEGPHLAADVGEDLSTPLKDFKGKKKETHLCYIKGQRALLLGLGKKEEATVETLRRAYSAVVCFAKEKKIDSLDILFPHCKQTTEFLRGIAEGIYLSNYSFSYKKEPQFLLKEIRWVGISPTSEIDEIQTVAEGVYLIRDLVNGNADDKIESFVNRAKTLHPKVKTTLFDKKKMQKMGMGLILAVNRASPIDPFLVECSYQGAPKSKKQIVLVGKGVTYDTGGLSLKPTDGMLAMKCDMAGAATVLGVIKTAAELKLKVNLTCLMPLTENGIGSKSYKLGDVYTSYSGKTVEINNTDAEGRLILADAMSYAAKHLNPSCIIDLATLTGACVVALGEMISALFSNDEALKEELLSASEKTDELLWELPTHSDYKESLKSDIADLVNSGGRDAGAIKAALFLKEFIEEVPWAHLDIAGPAFLSKPKDYYPTKATGFGLRLLIDFLKEKAQ